jgi:hypothetical protein
MLESPSAIDALLAPHGAEPVGDGVRSIVFDEEPWQSWFAWHPVKLYMTPHYAWLRMIYRRCVTKNSVVICDYTDTPAEFPTPTRK